MKRYKGAHMRKYKCNFICTVFLIITVIVLYILKNIEIIPNKIKLFTYLLILFINCLILLTTLVSIKSLNALYQHTFSGEEAKNKVKVLIKIIKEITNTKSHICLIIFAALITLGFELIFLLSEIIKINAYKLTDIILDVIAVLSLCNTFLQSHINYSINRYLSDSKKKKKP